MLQEKNNRFGLNSLALWLILTVFAGQALADKGPPNPPALALPGLMQTLTVDEKAWLAAHPVIRVAQDPGWPPIEFTDERGEPSGMSADYLILIEQRLGIKFEKVRALSWQDAYARMKRHEIDMTTSVAVTLEREKFWTFTRPYMKIPVVIIANADVTYIADIRELEGKKVAVVDGYAVADWIPRDFPTIELVRVKTVQEGLQALQRGKVFACIDNMLVAGYYMAKLKMTSLKIAGETPYFNAQCMAVRNDWAPLAGILQKALDSISEKEINDIYRKWLPIRYEHGFDYTLLWYALAIFTLILAGLAAWNWKLAREIRTRKEAEKALVNSENKFRLVFETANVGKSITRPNGKIEVNRAFCNMLGYTPEELKSKTWQDLTHPDDVESNQQLLVPLMQGEKDSVRFTKRYIHKNGTFLWADIGVAIHRDAGRHPLFFITTIIDITESKKTEEMERLAYDRLRQFIDSNIIGVVIATADGKIIEANDYYLSLVGFTREEFESGKVDWRTITPPEWLSADEKAIKELRERGTCTPYEKEYVRRDGTRVPVLLTDKMLPGPEEQIAAFALNISELKRAEEKLSRSERVLQLYVEHSPAAIAMFDHEMKYIAASRRYLIDYDLGEQRLVGLSHYDVFPEISDRWKQIHRRCLAGAIEKADEDLFPRADGRVDWVRWEIRPWNESGGGIGGIILFSEVITESKRAEEALREANRHWQTTFDATNSAIWVLDSDQRVLQSNKTAEKFFHQPYKSFIGKHCWEIVHGTAQPISACPLLISKESLRRETMELQIGEGWFEITVDPILDAEGHYAGAVHNVSDITDRKQAESEREDALDEIRKLNDNLEQRISERTDELVKTIAQLEETNRVFVGRELKMMELKERIAELEGKDVKRGS